MGWYYTLGHSRKQLITDLTRDTGTSTLITHCTRGNVLWTVRQATDGHRWIGCDLLQRSSDGWGHKPMEEGMHPFYYTCPLKYLELVADSEPSTNAKWREGVKFYHAKQAEKRKERKQERIRRQVRFASQFRPVVDLSVDAANEAPRCDIASLQCN